MEVASAFEDAAVMAIITESRGSVSAGEVLAQCPGSTFGYLVLPHKVLVEAAARLGLWHEAMKGWIKKRKRSECRAQAGPFGSFQGCQACGNKRAHQVLRSAGVRLPGGRGESLIRIEGAFSIDGCGSKMICRREGWE
jgi:hypothetical protein